MKNGSNVIIEWWSFNFEVTCRPFGTFLLKWACNVIDYVPMNAKGSTGVLHSSNAGQRYKYSNIQNVCKS